MSWYPESLKGGYILKMSYLRYLTLASIVLFLISSPAVFADGGKISGLYFGDYYYIAAHHDEDLKSRNGFWTRRVYLTYDQKLNETFSSRVRFEVNSPDGLSAGASGKNIPYVKDAYFKISPKDSGHNIYLGRSMVPTYAVLAKLWGYRAVERSMPNLQKYGSTRDLGIAAKGKVPGVDMLSYHAMIGNGAGTGAETNKYKKGYLSATLKPSGGVVVHGYVDLEARGPGMNRTTYLGLLGYQMDDYRAGVQFSNQIRGQGEGKDDVSIQGVSVFGAAAVKPDKIWVFGRIDKMLSENPDAPKIKYAPISADAKANTIVAGVDYRPVKNVHIIPNLFMVFYDSPEVGEKPGSDLMARVTLYYKF